MEERSVAIEIEPEPGEDIHDLGGKLELLRQVLADRGGVALGSPASGRYGARIFVVADSPAAAVQEGVQRLQDAATEAGLPTEPIVNVEAPTLAELEDEAIDARVPDLLGVSELAEVLGVPHHLATILVRVKGFPPAAAELNAGPVWTRSSIDRFLRRTA